MSLSRTTRRLLLSSVFAFVLSIPAFTQHDHHDHGKDTVKKEVKTPSSATTGIASKKVSVKNANEHAEHDHGKGADHGQTVHDMSHAFSRSLPMNRNGSGTAWLPDNSPMNAYMFHKRKWN